VPSQKKYPVTLTVKDREALGRVTRTGVNRVSLGRRARVLLALDTAVAGVAGVAGVTGSGTPSSLAGQVQRLNSDLREMIPIS
jgi:Tfp pilus assembly pilus retraction ATPase PilT